MDAPLRNINIEFILPMSIHKIPSCIAREDDSFEPNPFSHKIQLDEANTRN